MEIQLEGDEVIKEVLVEVKPQKTAEQEIVAQQTVEAAHLDVGMEEPVVALKEIEVEKAGVTDAVAEKAAVADAVAQVEVEKPVQAAAEKVLEKATAVESEVEKAEQQQPEEEKTKATLQSSRTLVVLQGLPGSGKSLLARAIADSYQELCTVVSADDHGVKLDSPEASVEGYKALDNAVEACCRSTTAASMIVVDDTNHTHERLALFGELAEEHRLVVMFLEPRTEWRRDLPKLVKKSHRGLEEAKIQAIQGSLEETSLPLFFGWFLLPNVQDKVRCTSLDFLKQLDTLEAFKKHLADFTGQGEKEVDLEQYFQVKGALHCTTKFCDYGKAEGAVEYAEMPAVQKEYGSVFELSLTALFVTPRTVGARVSLTADQLVLWPADAEKQAEPAVPAAASLPLGSRAHVTLGCAEGVEPVQTGLDLLEILALQEDGQQGEPVEEMELGGSLTYYGKGRWMLSLKEPVSAQACFSSLYARKKPEEGKKEAEKRKKPKCVIL
ncbi:2',3'-cyclic-nucleotide 3'-phosphodiesterase [Aplochiton taeniatus]